MESAAQGIRRHKEARLDDRLRRIETAILEFRQVVRETETDVSKRLEKLENIFLLIDWHAFERAVAHKFAVDVQVDPALVEQRSCQPECEASPERQSAIREVDPRMFVQHAIPPLPMTGPPGLCLDTILLQTPETELEADIDGLDLSQRPAVDGPDQLCVQTDTLDLKLSTAYEEKATQIDIITEEKQMIIDELQRQVNELSQRPAADEADVLRAEIVTLQCKLSTANEENTKMLATANDLAVQVKNITDEKQKIINDLQRSAADGVDELRVEIDTLKLMLSTAYDEKAI